MFRAMTPVPAGTSLSRVVEVVMTSVSPSRGDLCLGVVLEVMDGRRMRQGSWVFAESMGGSRMRQGSRVFAESMGGRVTLVHGRCRWVLAEFVGVDEGRICGSNWVTGN